MADLSKNKARIEEIENEIAAAYTKIRELEAEAEKLLAPFPGFGQMNGRKFRVFRDTKRVFIPLRTKVKIEVLEGSQQNPEKNAVVVNDAYAGQLELFGREQKVIPVE